MIEIVTDYVIPTGGIYASVFSPYTSRTLSGS